MRNLKLTIGILGLAALSASCSKESSRSTGMPFNDESYGGFERPAFTEQETGPGLVFIEGGSFVMGRTEGDIYFEWDSEPRKVSVSSFYMDETEVTNFMYTEYLYWINRTYGADYPEVYNNALPDTNIWREKLAYNESYVKYYLRHPAYRDYPVVGISWLQANNFAKWRTDRVNEQILIREGLFEPNPNEVNDDNFSTDSYLAGQYQSAKRKEGLPSSDPNKEFRDVSIADGILLPEYRLPTEAEWEYAALGLIGESFEERIENRRIYPWSGNFIRNDNGSGNYLGDINDNFVRGRGDYMGVAGALNDGADITAPVYKYFPNDYGLYSMAGNVSEWVLDVYRPLTSEDANEFRAFRGNVYRTPVLNSEGITQDKYDIVEYDVYGVEKYINDFKIGMEDNRDGSISRIGQPTQEEVQLVSEINGLAKEAVAEFEQRRRDAANEKIQELIDRIKDSETVISPILLDGISDHVTNTPGQIRTRDVNVEENVNRINYKSSDNRDYLDGDLYTTQDFKNADEFTRSNDYKEYRTSGQLSNGFNSTTGKAESMYNWRSTSLINNRARVYKGGSWSDRAYFCKPSTRRFLDERLSSSRIGFRCAMDRLGGPEQDSSGGKRRKR